jgi:hypothetical protein
MRLVQQITNLNQKKNIYISSQAASLEKAVDSKASDPEGNELLKSGIRRAEMRRLFISSLSKQAALRMLCCKTLFKDKLSISVFDKPDVKQLI